MKGGREPPDDGVGEGEHSGPGNSRCKGPGAGMSMANLSPMRGECGRVGGVGDLPEKIRLLGLCRTE